MLPEEYLHGPATVYAHLATPQALSLPLVLAALLRFFAGIALADWRDRARFFLLHRLYVLLRSIRSE